MKKKELIEKLNYAENHIKCLNKHIDFLIKEARTLSTIFSLIYRKRIDICELDKLGVHKYNALYGKRGCFVSYELYDAIKEFLHIANTYFDKDLWEKLKWIMCN